MAIETQINYQRIISGEDAVTAAKNAKNAQKAGNPTTDRGTLIRKSNTEFDKNSFLKILSAQLSHLDPTQNQDSSAYVAQMAQFASMEQMANLNTTMSDYAHQDMIGKEVIINEKDDSGAYITGTVSEVIKKSGVTYYTVSINGKEQEIDAKNIIGAKEGSDYNLSANSRTALNSDFIAASALASKNQNVLMADEDANKKVILVKGKVIGAYIDNTIIPVAKIKVQLADGTIKTYKYADIVSAGDVTEAEMDTTIKTLTDAQAKAEADAKAKADALAKAEADAKAKEEADAKASTGA